MKRAPAVAPPDPDEERMRAMREEIWSHVEKCADCDFPRDIRGGVGAFGRDWHGDVCGTCHRIRIWKQNGWAPTNEHGVITDDSLGETLTFPGRKIKVELRVLQLGDGAWIGQLDNYSIGYGGGCSPFGVYNDIYASRGEALAAAVEEASRLPLRHDLQPSLKGELARLKEWLEELLVTERRQQLELFAA